METDTPKPGASRNRRRPGVGGALQTAVAPGAAVDIHSTKFDGSLHYEYAGVVVEASEQRVIAYTPPGVAVVSYRGKSLTRRHCLKLFYPSRYYNVFVLWDSEWNAKNYYVNLATPADLSAAGKIGFIDLDLDVIYKQGGDVLLDDEDEWEENRARFGYPADLCERVLTAKDELLAMAVSEAEPFDGSLFGWRPGEAVRQTAETIREGDAVGDGVWRSAD